MYSVKLYQNKQNRCLVFNDIHITFASIKRIQTSLKSFILPQFENQSRFCSNISIITTFNVLMFDFI